MANTKITSPKITNMNLFLLEIKSSMSNPINNENILVLDIVDNKFKENISIKKA